MSEAPVSSRARRAALAFVAASFLLLAACGSDSTTSSGSTTSVGSSDTTTPAAATGTATVSAAASLTEAFTEIGADYESTHPDTTITFSFDSSSTLATQILEGAPADLFASADTTNMTKLTDADEVAGEPQVFARNRLVIVTKPGNPAGITSLADLADAGVISLCGEEVPCGRFAAQALEKAGVTIAESSVTRGQNVKTTLTAVTEGDAVAGIVYVTDAATAGDAVDTVEIPDDVNVIAVYPIGVLVDARNPDLAADFLAYVLSPEGQAVLGSYGFLPPT